MHVVCWGCHMTWSWDPLTFGILLFSRANALRPMASVTRARCS